jgi:hypothetical protein
MIILKSFLQWRHGSLVCFLVIAVASWSIATRAAESDKLTSGKQSTITGQINGYRGIWFDLGQKSDYGSKYSGGLGTYTAKHCPLAIYSKRVNKTFFVYGGTTQNQITKASRHDRFYDHSTGLVCKPTVVHDKQNVNDPHDNPSLSMDTEGHLWVFVSGRGRHRPGYKYRSTQPFNTDSFDQISEEEFTYPQPWWIPESRIPSSVYQIHQRERTLLEHQQGRQGLDKGSKACRHGRALSNQSSHWFTCHYSIQLSSKRERGQENQSLFFRNRPIWVKPGKLSMLRMSYLL